MTDIDIPLASTIRKQLLSDDDVKLASITAHVKKTLQNPQWRTDVTFAAGDFRDIKQRDRVFHVLLKRLEAKGFEASVEHQDTCRDWWARSVLHIEVREE